MSLSAFFGFHSSSNSTKNTHYRWSQRRNRRWATAILTFFALCITTVSVFFAERSRNDIKDTIFSSDCVLIDANASIDPFVPHTEEGLGLELIPTLDSSFLTALVLAKLPSSLSYTTISPATKLVPSRSCRQTPRCRPATARLSATAKPFPPSSTLTIPATGIGQASPQHSVSPFWLRR